jgi:plasmid stabilization system protein ParE
MSYALVVQPEAEADAASIFDDLEAISPGLGHRFLDALDDLYDYLEQYPFGFQKRYKNYRHGYVRNFAYRMVYLVEGDMIYVYQIRHTRRNVDAVFGPYPSIFDTPSSHGPQDPQTRTVGTHRQLG